MAGLKNQGAGTFEFVKDFFMESKRKGKNRESTQADDVGVNEGER
jgi:hypothetical protein